MPKILGLAIQKNHRKDVLSFISLSNLLIAQYLGKYFFTINIIQYYPGLQGTVSSSTWFTRSGSDRTWRGLTPLTTTSTLLTPSTSSSSSPICGTTYHSHTSLKKMQQFSYLQRGCDGSGEPDIPLHFQRRSKKGIEINSETVVE